MCAFLHDKKKQNVQKSTCIRFRYTRWGLFLNLLGNSSRFIKIASFIVMLYKVNATDLIYAFTTNETLKKEKDQV